MSDDILDFFNSLSSTTVTDEESQQSAQKSSDYSPNSSYNPYTNISQGTYDDYSVTPNYTEEQTYNPTYNTTAADEYVEDSVKVRKSYKIDAPTIRKDETPVVNLVKTKHKIELQARMKIVIAMFSVIMSLLLFVSVYNFAYAGRLKSSFSEKQVEISALQTNISTLVAEYNKYGNTVEENAADAGYVKVTDENTMSIKLGDFHNEQVVESSLPSGWFDKVCDFLSGIFS